MSKRKKERERERERERDPEVVCVKTDVVVACTMRLHIKKDLMMKHV